MPPISCTGWFWKASYCLNVLYLSYVSANFTIAAESYGADFGEQPNMLKIHHLLLRNFEMALELHILRRMHVVHQWLLV